MRKLLFATAVLALAAPAVMAQAPSSSHTVTVTVNPLDAIDVQGDVTLVLAFDPVSGTLVDSDNTSILSWITNQAARKVTVQTSLDGFTYGLQVTAGTITETDGAAGDGGTAVGAMDLESAGPAEGAQDFITGINVAGAWCPLIYDATASVTDGTGSEMHTVTYTLTN
jgi:hypothetical protein